MNSIFGNTIAMTQKSMDYLWLKQTVTLDNLANNDTPGFKARYVTFEDKLKKSIQAAEQTGGNNRRALQTGIDRSSSTIRETTDAARLDGNNVQVEAENVELARSYFQYAYQMQSLNGDISRLRIAIKG